MDLGCSEAFSQLLATGMGAGKQEAELEADRELVAKARTGLVLFNFDHQVSFSFLARTENEADSFCARRCRTETVRRVHAQTRNFRADSPASLLLTGRTPIVQVDEAILRCQELLNHPLSIETDIKVVSTTELMTIRGECVFSAAVARWQR